MNMELGPPLPTPGEDRLPGYFYVAWYLDHDWQSAYPIRDRFAFETLNEAKERCWQIVEFNCDADTVWVYDGNDLQWFVLYPVEIESYRDKMKGK